MKRRGGGALLLDVDAVLDGEEAVATGASLGSGKAPDTDWRRGAAIGGFFSCSRPGVTDGGAAGSDPCVAAVATASWDPLRCRAGGAGGCGFGTAPVSFIGVYSCCAAGGAWGAVGVGCGGGARGAGSAGGFFTTNCGERGDTAGGGGGGGGGGGPPDHLLGAGVERLGGGRGGGRGGGILCRLVEAWRLGEKLTQVLGSQMMMGPLWEREKKKGSGTLLSRLFGGNPLALPRFRFPRSASDWRAPFAAPHRMGD